MGGQFNLALEGHVALLKGVRKEGLNCQMAAVETITLAADSMVTPSVGWEVAMGAGEVGLIREGEPEPPPDAKLPLAMGDGGA